MAYTGMQRSLIQEAQQYVDLGYKVSFAKGKELIGSFDHNANQAFTSWDSISIILNSIVCVDFDTTMIDIDEVLPPTLKEKSPRGWHLFYRVPSDVQCTPKIKWKENIDLLINMPIPLNRALKYGRGVSAPNWGGHVICAPSRGYTRVYPTITPMRDKLTLAPDWLIKELQK